MRIVTLVTDFGTIDPYVAAMKGTILSAAGDVRFVDITHEVPSHDVTRAQIILSDVWRYFPEGTIHLGVVDPGVGTTRRRILVEADGHRFVGPDNGLFGFTYEAASPRFWEITGDFRSSATFEGRDVFAVTVARMCQGVPVATLATPIASIIRLEIPVAEVGKKKAVGEIIYIDRFGNLCSNIAFSDISSPRKVTVHKGRVLRVVKTYAEGKRREPVALWNDFGRLEIAVREGSAKYVLKAHKGMKIIVEK